MKNANAFIEAKFEKYGKDTDQQHFHAEKCKRSNDFLGDEAHAIRCDNQEEALDGNKSESPQTGHRQKVDREEEYFAHDM